jgi:ketosteroid isomerase-like protein
VPVTRIELAPLSERAAGRRSLDERLVVRFPGLFRRAARWALRLPASRVRRWLLGRFIQHGYAAANRRDFELLLIGIDPDHEYRPSPGLMLPDLGGPTHGHEGYLRMWGNYLDAFEDIRFEPAEVLDFGEKFLVTVRQAGHGSGSGIGLSQPIYQLLTMRDGLTIRQEDFLDRDEALRAATST